MSEIINGDADCPDCIARWKGHDGEARQLFREDKFVAWGLMTGGLFVMGQETNDNEAAITVNANDVFAWGCADAEPLPACEHEIEQLYREIKGFGHHGWTRWLCMRRNEKPQAPIETQMRDEGAWDDLMQMLPPNTTQEVVTAILAEAWRRRGIKESTK